MLNKKKLIILTTVFVLLVIIILLWTLLSIFPSKTQTNNPSITPLPTSIIQATKPTPYVPKGAAIYYYNKGKDYAIYDPKYATLEQIKEFLKNPDH